MLGNGTATWEGNINFRKIIWQYRKQYQQVGRFQKTVVALHIFREIAKLQPPGRFLDVFEKDLDDGTTYFEISKDRAVEKICQALREKTMKKPNGAHDSDSSLTGLEIVSKMTKTTTKKQAKIKKGKRGKKKTVIKVQVPRHKPGKVFTFNRSRRATRESVRRSYELNEAAKAEMIRDCSAFAMVSPLKCRGTRNSSKSMLVTNAFSNSPRKEICTGGSPQVPFECCKIVPLKRDDIMRMSRHVPVSAKMVNGNNGYGARYMSHPVRSSVCQMETLECQIETLECQMETLKCQMEVLECQMEVLERQMDVLECQTETLDWTAPEFGIIT
jgi:hypothetical protein